MARAKADSGPPVIKLVTVRGKPDKKMLARILRAAQIMVTKSWERGQAWKRTGMYGAFLEIYNCYMRLATLMENRKKALILDEHRARWWAKEFDNVLDDMRNFTTLFQLAMDAGKFDSDYIPPKPKREKKIVIDRTRGWSESGEDC